jgi:hypothetical protein
VIVITEAPPRPRLTYARETNEGDMLAQRGSLIFGAALTMCGLVDFVTTMSLCIILVGIGWAPRILAEPDYLSALFG